KPRQPAAEAGAPDGGEAQAEPPPGVGGRLRDHDRGERVVIVELDAVVREARGHHRAVDGGVVGEVDLRGEDRAVEVAADAERHVGRLVEVPEQLIVVGPGVEIDAAAEDYAVGGQAQEVDHVVHARGHVDLDVAEEGAVVDVVVHRHPAGDRGGEVGGVQVEDDDAAGLGGAEDQVLAADGDGRPRALAHAGQAAGD